MILPLVAACASSLTGNEAPSPNPSSATSLVVVFTTWAPDAKVANGPEPGYRPALSGLTSHNMSAASAVLDASGTQWVIHVWFTTTGTMLFAKLTRDNVAACGGDANVNSTANCAPRHLGIWLNLTQSDIDNWDEFSYVAQVGSPFDMACLVRAPQAAPCPKLLSDPITLEEIEGGQAEIAANFTRQTAEQLASAINSGPHE